MTLFSIAMIGVFIWATGVLVPRARRKNDRFALACALLTAALALAAWLFLGIGVRS